MPSKAEGFWHEILQVTEVKQHLFIQRILFIHDLTKRKAGKAQTLKVSPSTWELEADVACLAGHIFNVMQTYRDPENLIVFDASTIPTAMGHFVEGNPVMVKFCLQGD